MKVIESQVKELTDNNIIKKIERCGRICYKSEDKITNESCYRFVKGLVVHQHWAMLEHAWLCLRVTEKLAKSIRRLGHGTYLNITLNGREDRFIISGNIRAWMQLFNPYKWTAAEWVDISRVQNYVYMILDEKTYYTFFTKPESIPHRHLDNVYLSQEDILKLPNITLEEAQKHLYLTAVFTCDRGVTHELVRHRPASFAQESTRYCNYTKEGFGKEIICIKPTGMNPGQTSIWLEAMEYCESQYFKLISEGCTPQQARGVLPTDIKAELVISTNLEEWQHIINLRYHGTTGNPHPACKEVMTKWYNYIMSKKGYNKYID